MMYKGFEIVPAEINGTRWFIVKKDGCTLVNYTEFMGARTGSSHPMMFLDEKNAKKTIRYLLSSGTVDEHI